MPEELQLPVPPRHSDMPGPRCPRPECGSLDTVRMDEQSGFNFEDCWCYGCDKYFRATEEGTLSV